MLRTLLQHAIPAIIGAALFCFASFCRRKWPKFIGLLDPNKVQLELSQDLGDLHKSLDQSRSECEELRRKDERRTIAFEELFDQVQGYRLVRDTQQGIIDRAQVKLVKMQQDMEGVHKTNSP